MPLLKCIETWVLLAVIGAGTIFVFVRRHPDAVGQSAACVPLKIHCCTLERDYGNTRLDAADLKGPLKLEVNGNIVKVKGAKAFYLMTMKNAEKKIFSPAEW